MSDILDIVLDIIDRVISWIASRIFIKNQWRRLFSGDDYNAILFLKSFEQSNDWIEMPCNIAEYNFGGYEYDYCNIEFKEETYNLFQTNGQKIRITPIIYPTFSKQLKKAIKTGLVQ